ncbi:MAG: DUF1572 family protein [Acidobacteriota bacterium]
MSRTVIEPIEAEYRRYHQHTLRALDQINEEQLNTPGPGGNNSVAVIIQHVSGNLRSRFTDFLTTDGEKPDRNRDAEFEEPQLTLDSARALWTRGFDVVFAALAALDDSHLTQTVTIRQQPLTVVDALLRSLAHTAGHAFQIIYLAKSLRAGDWHTLTIPRGQSAAYNANPTLEKPPK